MQDLNLLIHSELQDDYVVQTPLTDVVSNLSLLSDAGGNLNIFYIAGKKVINAYQTTGVNANSAAMWTLDDMHFPDSVQPRLITSLVLSSGAMFICVTGDDTNFYLLDTSTRYTTWRLLVNNTVPPKSTPRLLRSFLDPTRKPWLGAVYDPTPNPGTIYVGNVTKGYFAQDPGTMSGVTDYHVGSTLGDTGAWGYIECGWRTAGQMALFTTRSNTATEPGKRRYIANGTYTSIAYIPMGSGTNTPLVFAIDSTERPVYFEADGLGNFTSTKPFSVDISAVKLEAVLRHAFGGGETATEWVELFALDGNGNLWHVESLIPKATANVDADPPLLPKSSLKQLKNGDFAVTGWKSAAIIAQSVGKFYVGKAGDGPPHIITIDRIDNTMKDMVQDPATTDWTITTIVKAPAQAVPTATKRSVYYVEVAVIDKNRLKMPGLPAIIGATEFAEVDINGRTVFLDGTKTIRTTTNEYGKICFTTPVNKTLSCPTFSVWVEGMDPQHRTDFNGAADIQTKFSTITAADLAAAKDQRDGSLIFAAVSDADKQKVADGLNKAMKSFGVNAAEIEDAILTRTYLHPKTRHGLARTRRLGDKRTLARIRGKNGVPFRIVFGENFAVHTLTHEDATSHIDKLKGRVGASTLSLAFGTLALLGKQGLAKFKEVVIKPVVDAADVTITFIKDGAEYLWNGVVHFVSAVFEVVQMIFEQVGVLFEKLKAWLMYLLGWDDIKHTVDAFKGLFTKVVANGKDCFDVKIPSKVDPFFNGAKAWFDTNYDKASSGMKDKEVRTYDSDNLSATPGLVEESPISKFFDDLPSTATWLLQKVLAGLFDGGGEGIQVPGLDSLMTLWQTFVTNLTASGFTDSMNKALTKIQDFFLGLVTRAAIDASSFSLFLDAFKDAMSGLISLGQAVVKTFLNIASKFLDSLIGLFNSTLEIPILSAIFKAIAGVDLSLFNIILFPLAIPVTIVYKLIAGKAPYSSALDENGHHALQGVGLADPSGLVSGIIYFFNVAPDIALDIIAVASNAISAPGGTAKAVTFGPTLLVKRILTAWSLAIPVLQLGLSTYPTITDGAGRLYTAWTINAVTVVYNGFAWVTQKTEHGAREGFELPWRPLGLSLLGVAGEVTTIWHFINVANGTEPANAAAGATIAAEFFAPLSTIAKFLSLAKDPTGIAALTLFSLDAASGIGAATAMITASM